MSKAPTPGAHHKAGERWRASTDRPLEVSPGLFAPEHFAALGGPCLLFLKILHETPFNSTLWRRGERVGERALAQEVGVTRPTIHRWLTALIAGGYIRATWRSGGTRIQVRRRIYYRNGRKQVIEVAEPDPEFTAQGWHGNVPPALSGGTESCLSGGTEMSQGGTEMSHKWHGNVPEVARNRATDARKLLSSLTEKLSPSYNLPQESPSFPQKTAAANAALFPAGSRQAILGEVLDAHPSLGKVSRMRAMAAAHRWLRGPGTWAGPEAVRFAFDRACTALEQDRGQIENVFAYVSRILHHQAEQWGAEHSRAEHERIRQEENDHEQKAHDEACHG